jgi:hypothetical protein
MRFYIQFFLNTTCGFDILNYLMALSASSHGIVSTVGPSKLKHTARDFQRASMGWKSPVNFRDSCMHATSQPERL